MRGYISTTYVFNLAITGSSPDGDMLYKVTTYRPATGTDNGSDTIAYADDIGLTRKEVNE